MHKVIPITDTPSTPSRKTQLDDATSAFYFSRLQREERIATILFKILEKQGVYSEKEDAYPCEDGCFPVADKLTAVTDVRFPLTNSVNLLDVAKELALYSVKDFAVRYGKL